MRPRLSIFRDSLLFRFIAAPLLAVFVAWFVLPSCPCQLQVMFGSDEQGETQSAKTGYTIVVNDGSNADCHCDDHCPKVFELTAGIHVDSLNRMIQVALIEDYEPLNQQRNRTYTNRGPPAYNWNELRASQGCYKKYCTFLI